MGTTPMQRLWVLLLFPQFAAKASRPFDGTYTVVNKANGHRMFASTKAGLYIVDDTGPIYGDQMWLLAPQDNNSYAIINAANGLRIVAQSAGDGADGFFAMDHGPVYQDQRWHLSLQLDGSYAIENVKSGRRILARPGGDVGPSFAAVKDSGPIRDDECWWLINQERDDTARLLAELALEKTRLASLMEDAAVAKNASSELKQRLQDALGVQGKLLRESYGFKNETSRLASLLQDERSANAQLSKDIQVHEGELLRMRAALLEEERSKERLQRELMQHQERRMQREMELDEAKLVQSTLSEDLKTNSLKSAKLQLELRKLKAANEELLSSLLAMHNEVARLRSEVGSANVTNFELAAKVKLFESQPECWIPPLEMDASKRLLVTICIVVLATMMASCGRLHVSLLSEVRGKRKRIRVLEQEMRAEFGDMVSVGDSDNGLGCDFGFCVFNTEINQEAVRLIKVQCPGVKHADVEIELIFNGCEVIIQRHASRGVACATWKRRFQFKPSDGLFEFREEQMLLEDGFLQLVFRACAFQSRRVLFPRHFNLTESDADTCWDFSADTEVDKRDEVDAWWNEPEGATSVKDTESTASTARLRV